MVHAHNFLLSPTNEHLTGRLKKCLCFCVCKHVPGVLCVCVVWPSSSSREQAQYDWRFGYDAKRVKGLVDFQIYTDDLAKEMGVLPPLMKLFFQKPKLWMAIMFGPVSVPTAAAALVCCARGVCRLVSQRMIYFALCSAAISMPSNERIHALILLTGCFFSVLARCATKINVLSLKENMTDQSSTFNSRTASTRCSSRHWYIVYVPASSR